MHMASSGRYLIALVVFICLGGYFHLFFIAPSAARILYIQTVTLTRKVPVEIFAQYDPSISMPCIVAFSPCGVFQAMFTEEELVRMKIAAEAAVGRKVDRGLQEATHIRSALGGVGVDASQILGTGDDEGPHRTNVATHDQTQTGLITVANNLRNSHLRFSSKHHISHQLLEMWHYPISFLLCSRAHLCDYPWLTPNLITFSHLGIGIIAGLCFYRASKHWDSRVRATLRAGADVSDDSTSSMTHDTPKAEPPNGGDALEMTAASVSCEGTPSAPQKKRMHRNLSASAVNYKVPSLNPEGSLNNTAAVEMTEFSVLTPSNAVAVVQPGESSAFLGASTTSTPPMLGTPTSAGHRRRWILLATWLFALRNLLDTLDGVVARYQRLQAVGGDSSLLQPNPLVFGLNGHTIDTVCDFIGGLVCCLGICSTMWNQPVLISRLPRIVLTKLGLRQKIRHHAALPKWVAFCGLTLTGVSAAGWDPMMIKYSSLFDVYSDGNDNIFALEQMTQVRINQFLWSLVCGDCLFTYLTLALVLDQLWLVLQLFVFVGYPYCALLTCHSLYLWYVVILGSSPEATALMTK
jgi:phosphatidylglycerophosphate synthase